MFLLSDLSTYSGSPAENASLETDPPANLDEDTLIRLSREDLAQFRPLYERWLPPVYRYFYHRVGSVQEAEELTSQVFLAVCEGLPKYLHRGYFAAWLFSIARRRAADYYRQRQSPVPMDEVDPADPTADYLAQVARADDIQRLREVIRALPEKDQELIRLRFVSDLTYAEIAALFKRNKEAVRKQLSRLLVRLLNQLEESDE